MQFNDASGLYRIVWHGTWTLAQQARVMDGINAIAARLEQILKLLENELSSLPKCAVWS